MLAWPGSERKYQTLLRVIRSSLISHDCWRAAIVHLLQFRKRRAAQPRPDVGREEEISDPISSHDAVSCPAAGIPIHEAGRLRNCQALKTFCNVSLQQGILLNDSSQRGLDGHLI